MWVITNAYIVSSTTDIICVYFWNTLCVGLLETRRDSAISGGQKDIDVWTGFQTKLLEMGNLLQATTGT